MATKRISAIKIKQLSYADVLSAAPTKEGLAAAIEAATKIDNIHQGTYSYEETEATVNKYENELTGDTYRSDVEAGDITMSFTIGQYDFQTKAALQGGKGTADSWERGGMKNVVYKAIYAITEDDVCIVFPKARIVGRGSSTDNAIGIAVSAIPEEIGGGISLEYWFVDWDSSSL